jgi:cellulose synthase/poly-beta-1,6-N-acetylglucosamine synthase-like glycosyltransferase
MAEAGSATDAPSALRREDRVGAGTRGAKWTSGLALGLAVAVAVLSGRAYVLWMAAYGLATVALLVFGFHAFGLLAWRRRHAPVYLDRLEEVRRRSPLGTRVFPRVLVQVPVFSEPEVVERVVDAVAALDYPRDALEIQILDDSTDETVEIVDRAVARHRAAGVPAVVLRRSHREGFKAGALAEGLRRSDAQFVAVFDADFTPERDFLRRALPLFDAQERVACVQGRWGHHNRPQNWLTRAQAVGVDAHFRVHQLARAATGRFLNFNGTAGVWRVDAIEDAGGWSGDTLTEDLDLSYRAQLRGWRIVFDPDLVVRGELPPTLGAFKTQQRRWASGSTQCARKYLGPVWKGDLPVAHKLDATLHLCGYVVCVAMSLLTLLVPLAVADLPVLSRAPLLWPVWVAIWVAATGPVAVAVASQAPRGRLELLDVASGVLLGLGSCVNNAVAVLRGLFRPIRTFVRTPKQGTRRTPIRAPAPGTEQVMAAVSLAILLAFPADRPWALAAYAASCGAGFWTIATYWWVVERRRVPA